MYIVFIMIGWILGLNISLYTIFGQSYLFNFLLLVSSFVFGFCLWHRILIYSMTFILFLETLQGLKIELNYYAYICVAITIISLILSTILFYINGKKSKK